MVMAVASGMLAAGAAARAGDLKSEVLGNLQSDDRAIREAAAKTVIGTPSLSTNVTSDIEAIAQQFIADDKRKGTAKTAILLLGKLKSERSIPFLVNNLKFLVFRISIQTVQEAYPCAGALMDIGEPAFPAVFARWVKDDDDIVDGCVRTMFLKAKDKNWAREFLTKSMEKLKAEKDRNKVKALVDLLSKDSLARAPSVKKSEPQSVTVKECTPQSVTINGITYTAPLKPMP
ncbi:MAG: hypothetical protein WCV00_22035 [Verrucomicrobiia bacterium]